MADSVRIRQIDHFETFVADGEGSDEESESTLIDSCKNENEVLMFYTAYVGTKSLKYDNVDIFVAYWGELGLKQPNSTSVSESKVLFPVE